MKAILSLSTMLLLAISFSACVKSVEVSVPTPTHSITGIWYVSDASYLGSSGWYSFDAGLQGIFSFYSDGSAQYSDNAANMQGDWNSSIVTTGYYDDYGNYQIDSHKDFAVSVSGNGGSIDLYFDDISFAGDNQFAATYYDGKSVERYTFVRY